MSCAIKEKGGCLKNWKGKKEVGLTLLILEARAEEKKLGKISLL